MSMTAACYVLIISTVFLIMQEDFLVEKVPYILFYTCKLLLKTLSLRSRFERKRSLKDFVFLWLVCFGKKAILDIAYYQVNWLRYIRYCILLFVIDYGLDLLSRKGITHKDILKIKPVKTLLMLTSGICDSISLENLLWRNHINGWMLDAAVFFFVVLDPLLYCGFAWFFKGQKKEKNFSSCQRNLNFGIFLTIMHSLFSMESYSTLILLRRQIPFNSSNVMTPAVGMRLLNCVAYVIFATYSLTLEFSSPKPLPQIPQVENDEKYISEKKDRLIPGHLEKSKAKLDKIIHSIDERKIK